jgi:hypothetical protein
MESSAARGVAGGGALLSAASLLMPWYVLRVGDVHGLGKSGIDALGYLATFVVVLAIGAGWSATARIHRLLPAASAAALTMFVLVKMASPPPASAALGSTDADPLTSQLLGAFAAGLGLHYAPAWGIWLAAIGALAALGGTVITAAQHTR